MLSLTPWIPVYDRVVVPALRRFTKHEGGITLLQRIGVGLALSVATMLVSCFWLVPQLLLAGLSEAFGGIGQLEFFYRQFQENMRSVAGAIYCLGFALASYASGVMVTVVHRATRGRDGRPDWLAQDLDQGRIDLFYLVTAAIAAVNLIYFVVCARWYRFKESNGNDDGSHASADVELVPKMSASAAPV
ncbi:protein NRT1/ PTR FAMILY 2.13-like [Triticum aestivum]|nr:protein NRT1/ PTR FAMILY 2.13-like [Triticum aestivum]